MSDEMKYEVVELGEDGDDWIVTGTSADTPDALVHIAVGKYILDTSGVQQDAVATIADLHTYAALSFRPDWGWQPIDPSLPDDECFLVHGDNVPEDIEKFAATRVSL